MFGKKGNLIGFLLSAICLFLVFQKVDFHRLSASIATLDLRFVGAALIVFMTTFFVRTLRWQVLLAPAKPMRFKRLFSVVMIGYMANNLLPARLGEFARAYVLGSKEGVRKTTTLATIFIERIFDGLSLLFILGLFLWLYDAHVITLADPLPGWVTKGGLIAGAGFVGAFGFVAALEFFPGLANTLKGLFRRFAPAHLAPKLESVLTAFVDGVACLRSGKTLIGVFLASLLIWVIEGTTYFMLGQAFHLELPFSAFLVTMVLVNLGTIVPSAPGFVGTFQLFCVLALGLFGIPKEVALSYGLVLNIGEYLPVTLLGIACLLGENMSFRTMLDGGEPAAAAPAAEEELPATQPS